MRRGSYEAYLREYGLSSHNTPLQESMLTPCVHQKAEVLPSRDGSSVSVSPDGSRGGEREGKEGKGKMMGKVVGGWGVLKYSVQQTLILWFLLEV